MKFGNEYANHVRSIDRRYDPYTRDQERRTETDVSAGWREEHQAVHVPLPDGGVEYLLPDEGAVVFDREDLRDDRVDPSRAVVVETHPTVPAAEFYVDEIDATVAQVNEIWDPDSPVIKIAFVDEIEHAGGDPDDITAAQCDRLGIQIYSYPSNRVVRAERVSDEFAGGGR